MNNDMTPEEFYEQGTYPKMKDKFDMTRNQFDYYALMQFAYDYAQQKLNIASVVRPVVECAKDGGLLPAEALEKSVSAGPCCCNNTTLGQTECDGLCVDIDEYD